MRKFLTILSGILLVLAVVFLFKGCTLTAEEITRTVHFTWTATGDDGTLGTASEYVIKYSTSIDSLTNNWDACEYIVYDGVIPVAFMPMSWTIDIVFPATGTYYFAIKAADEVPNWSNISNIISIPILDDIAPAAIIDFIGNK
jgi:hypothetical protein